MYLSFISQVLRSVMTTIIENENCSLEMFCGRGVSLVERLFTCSNGTPGRPRYLPVTRAGLSAGFRLGESSRGYAQGEVRHLAKDSI